MNEWIYEWINERMDEWISEGMSGWVSEWIEKKERINESKWMHKNINECMNKLYMNRKMN